jgi:hypothetical protein
VRVTNRLLAALLALALLAGGLLAAAEIVYGGARGRPLVVPWDDWFDGARNNDWSSREVRVLSLVLLAVGAALLLLQVLRRGPQSLPVGDDAAQGGARRRLTVEANTRSLERALIRAVGAVDGVDRASVSLSRTQARVDVRTSRRELAGLELAARQAVDARLATAGIRRPEQVNLRVRRTKQAQRAVESAAAPPAGVTP